MEIIDKYTVLALWNGICSAALLVGQLCTLSLQND